ncbi:MAG TPA: hypothetical protein VJA66_09210 [Thermoanaerobaculia bacterium]
MKRWEAWTNHLAIAAVSLSGLVYGVMKYGMTNADPDSRIGHPWQPWALRLHILAAPIAVFGLGLIFRRHALARFLGGDREGRRSGRILTRVAIPLGLSGYLVQALTGEVTRRWSGWVHAGLGVLFVAAYALHPRRSRLPDDASEAASDAERGAP